METGTKEYYADYYQKNKKKHNAKMIEYRKNSKEQQLYQKEYQKIKYNKKKENFNLEDLRQEWRDQAKKKNKKRRQFIDEYKSTCSCKKCGDIRSYVLDFHHIDSNEKEFDLGDASKYSIPRLKLELEKCITLCRNCHSEFHYLEKQQGINIEEYLNTNETGSPLG
jgi:Zn finger protein HypA/HybF involved in hydrogenase expression